MLCTTALVAATATAGQRPVRHLEPGRGRGTLCRHDCRCRVRCCALAMMPSSEMLARLHRGNGHQHQPSIHPPLRERAGRNRSAISLAGGDLDIALIDLVWIGNFAGERVDRADRRPHGSAHPNWSIRRLNMDDFFPLVLNAFGRLERCDLRPALRQLFGLMFYNRLHAGGGRFRPSAGNLAGADGWSTAPRLTGDGQYALCACSPSATRRNRPTASRACSGPSAGRS